MFAVNLNLFCYSGAMQKPIIVFVSGAPGSGKTTLSKLLSEHLYLPQISSDLIHGGIAFTQPNHDRKQTLKNIFVPTIIDASKKGISVVVDSVLQKNMSELDVIDRLRPYAKIIYIHAQCNNPIQRYEQRVSNSELPSIVARREHLLRLVKPHTENLTNTYEPLDLGVPTLVVNTDDGYDPGMADIVAFVQTATAN